MLLKSSLRYWTYATWSVPVLVVWIFFSFAARARLELGYWPTCGNPDPKALEWPVHYGAVMLSVVAMFPGLLPLQLLKKLSLPDTSTLRTQAVNLAFTSAFLFQSWLDSGFLGNGLRVGRLPFLRWNAGTFCRRRCLDARSDRRRSAFISAFLLTVRGLHCG